MRPQGVSRLFCALMWATLILVPLMVVSAVLLPWWLKVQQLDAQIVEQQDQLLRFQRIVATRPLLERELEQVRNNDAFKAFYFDASTQALAGAQLQSKVQEIVNSASGRLVSTQLLPEDANETPPKIRVRTQIQGSTESLVEVLQQIESARPFLFVERLSVRSSARPVTNATRRPRRQRSNPDVGDLTIRLDIFGFALGG